MLIWNRQKNKRTAFEFSLKPMTDGPSFSYEKLVRETSHKKLVYKSHTEPSKFLVREKTRTRNYDTRTNFLYQDSRTSFSYKKLGPSAISIKIG